MDCDGTLVDSVRLAQRFGAVLPKYGKTIDSDIFDRVEAVIGGCQIGVDELIALLQRKLYEEFCALH